VLVPVFASAPFGVTEMLLRRDGSLPTQPWLLPPRVTDVWLASGWVGSGLRWTEEFGWRRFDTDLVEE
jgi:hypothetical protein